MTEQGVGAETTEPFHQNLSSFDKGFPPFGSYYSNNERIGRWVYARSTH